MCFILALSQDAGKTWVDDYEKSWNNGAEAQERARELNARHKNSTWYRDWRYRVRKVTNKDEDFMGQEMAKNHNYLNKSDFPSFVWWPAWRLAHFNPENKRQVRFFREIDDAHDGKYTTMSLSRFLSRILDLEGDDDFIQDYLVSHDYYDGDYEFKILRKSEEIVHAYKNGPSSCMADEDDYPLPEPHPVSVYGDGPDLGLATIWRDGECSARALVWPDKKIYGRIYGHAKLLEMELKKLGYRQTMAFSPWRGARVLKIWDKSHDAYIGPYIDVTNYLTEARDGKHFRFSGNNGSYSCNETEGYFYSESSNRGSCW